MLEIISYELRALARTRKGEAKGVADSTMTTALFLSSEGSCQAGGRKAPCIIVAHTGIENTRELEGKGTTAQVETYC